MDCWAEHMAGYGLLWPLWPLCVLWLTMDLRTFYSHKSGFADVVGEEVVVVLMMEKNKLIDED